MKEENTHKLPPSEIPDELLARWLSDDLSEAEIRELEKEYGAEALENLRKVAEEAQQLSPPPFNAKASWDHLEAQIDAESAKEESTPTQEKEIEPSPRRLNSRRRQWTILTLAASVALLAVVFFFRPGAADPGIAMIEVVASSGMAKQVVLPDGSELQLEPGSVLRYPEKGWDAERYVELAGSAYFKVAKGMTFRVLGEKGSTEVLGTRFSVFSTATNLEVTCYSGRVKVTDSDEKQVEVLNPGQHAYLKEGKFERLEETKTLPTWAVREFSYDGEELSKVLAVLEMEFDVEVECGNCQGKRFSGSFSNEELEASLNAVTVPYGMAWTKTAEGKYRVE